MLKLPSRFDAYVTPERALEANIIKATFICAFTNVQFQANLIDIKNYASTIESAYGSTDLSSSAEGLCSYAEALITFSSSLRLLNINNPKSLTRDTLAARWSALSTALKHLTAATKVPETENLVKIHIARGDVEVHRFQLGQMDVVFEPARDNSSVLLRNAGKYYAGAKNVASTFGGWEEEVSCSLPYQSYLILFLK